MEIEFKFQVPAAQAEAVENALRSDGAVEQIDLEARYFDTHDGRLAGAGIALRLRNENGQWIQTVKARGEGVLDRYEHSVSLAFSPGLDTLPDIRLHKGTPVGRFLKKALHGAPLVLTFCTDISRVVSYANEGESTAELALDRGEVRVLDPAGRLLRASAVCELEIELMAGRASDLVPIARRWIERHGLFASTLSKSARGHRLVAEKEGQEAVKAVQPRYPKEAVPQLAGKEIQRRVISACLQQVLTNASEVGAGSADPDVVHQLRIGLRRLRTALRELDRLDTTSFARQWQEPLQRVFGDLGRSRDRSLLVGTIQPRLEAAGGPALALPKRSPSEPDICAAVRATDFQIVLCELVGFTMAADKQDPAAGEREEAASHARRQLRKRLRSLHKAVVAAGQDFATLPPEQQHRVRKRLKRLRYLSEFVGPMFGDKAAARYIKALTPAQDCLGEFNDNTVAAESYSQLAVKTPKAWFAVGWLSALQPSTADECRRAIRQIGKARKFWTHAATRGKSS